MLIDFLKTLNYKIIIAIYSTVVFLLHIIPTGRASLNKIEILSFRADYLLHTAVLLPWMILVWLHINKEEVTGSLLKQIILWFIAGLLLATFSEGIQYWLPYRSFNVMDVIFNVSGVALGALIFIWTPNMRKSFQLDE